MLRPLWMNVYTWNGCCFCTPGVCIDQYLESSPVCLPDDYQAVHATLYVDVTFEGCKSLCQNLHDLTCSVIVFLPLTRSCFLQPLATVRTAIIGQNCSFAQIYKRVRCAGIYHRPFVIILWSAICHSKSTHDRYHEISRRWANSRTAIL